MKKYSTSVIIASAIFTAMFFSAVETNAQNPAVTKNNTNGLDEQTLRQKMKADGVSDVLIDKLLAQRKVWLEKGKNVAWINVARTNPPVPNAACSDMGVENGWGSWSGKQGDNSAGPSTNITYQASSNPPPAPTSLFDTTSGTSINPNTPSGGNPVIPVVCPFFGGSHSIVLNESCTTGFTCEQLTYPLTVTAQDTSFVYANAMIIENAGHAVPDQPFVEFDIYDSLGNLIPNSHQLYTGGPNMPGFYPVSGNGCGYAGTDQYKPWTLTGVNLSAYVGHTLNVVIINADCDQGGHFATSYWDFACNSSINLFVSTTSTQDSCMVHKGTATAAVFGGTSPYTYLWNNGQTTPTATGLSAGTYTVTVTDSNSVTATSAIAVNNASMATLPTNPICMVTVDSLSQHNVIMWDKTTNPPVDSFIVYREISTNNYQPIGSVPYNALSLFIDTVRTKYFPNTGDPNMGTYRYKIIAQDSCASSLFSPYHNTIFITNNSGVFSWSQLYTIENSANPVNSYVLMRDDYSNGNWHAINSVSGTQQTIVDPAYSTYQSTASWRVVTNWNITCVPSRIIPHSLASFNSSLSNIWKTTATGVNPVNLNSQITVFPNPSSGNLFIDFGNKNLGKTEISFSDVLGRILQEAIIPASGTQKLDVSGFSKGIYFIQLKTDFGIATKKIVIAK